MFKQSRDDGFSVLEIVVAAAILGILAAIAVPMLFGNIEGADRAELESDISNTYSLTTVAVQVGDDVPTRVIPAYTTVTYPNVGTITASTPMMIVGGESQETLCIDGYIDGAGVMNKTASGVAEGVCASRGTDSDGDGYANEYETITGSDPGNTASTPWTDNDLDGFSNIVEYDAGTDPTNPVETPVPTVEDTDGDQYVNVVELVYGSDPNNSTSTPGDTNADGVFDIGDSANPGAAAGPADSDLDGYSDVDETAAGSDPNDPASTPLTDDDGDGFSNADETAAGSDPNDPASTPTDRDGDGWNNNEETLLGSNPDDPNSVPPPTLTYGTTTFTSGSNAETFAPTVSGLLGTPTFDIVSGTLPTGVTFDDSTGTFTGPDASAWNFTATQVSGGRHSCAVTTAGGLKCWGWNNAGQLGDGTTTNRTTPVDVVGLTSGVASVAVGSQSTCAITTAGALKCWGNYGAGAFLGDGTSTGSRTPVNVTGLSSGVTQVSMAPGTSMICAVVSGSAKCWGGNTYGQVGDGTTSRRYTPTDVTGLSSGVAQVAAGTVRTCALMTSGSVKCWGTPLSEGGLGDGQTNSVYGCYWTTFYLAGFTQATCESSGYTWEARPVGKPSLTPVNVTGLAANATSIAVGDDHTCALLTTGGVQCWGYNNTGQLGDGTTTNRGTPVTVSGLSSGVSQISTGPNTGCVTTTSGAAKCWGANGQGGLGDGSTTTRLTPVDVSGLSSGVTQVSSSLTSCARLADSSVKCWGYNNTGQLGDGTTTNSSIPVLVAGVGGFPSTVTVRASSGDANATTDVTLARN